MLNLVAIFVLHDKSSAIIAKIHWHVVGFLYEAVLVLTSLRAWSRDWSPKRSFVFTERTLLYDIGYLIGLLLRWYGRLVLVWLEGRGGFQSGASGRSSIRNRKLHLLLAIDIYHLLELVLELLIIFCGLPEKLFYVSLIVLRAVETSGICCVVCRNLAGYRGTTLTYTALIAKWRLHHYFFGV